MQNGKKSLQINNIIPLTEPYTIGIPSSVHAEVVSNLCSSRRPRRKKQRA